MYEEDELQPLREQEIRATLQIDGGLDEATINQTIKSIDYLLGLADGMFIYVRIAQRTGIIGAGRFIKLIRTYVAYRSKKVKEMAEKQVP